MISKVILTAKFVIITPNLDLGQNFAEQKIKLFQVKDFLREWKDEKTSSKRKSEILFAMKQKVAKIEEKLD